VEEEAPPPADRPSSPRAPGSTIFTTYIIRTIAGKEEWVSRTTFTLADGTIGNQCSSSMPMRFFPEEVVEPAPPRGPTQPLPRSSAAASDLGGLETATGRRVDPFASQTSPMVRTSADPRSLRHGGARPANGVGRDVNTQGLLAVPPKDGQPRLRRTPAFHRSPEQFPDVVARSRVGSLVPRPHADSVPSLPIKHKQH
jgi:hypothetical protein